MSIELNIPVINHMKSEFVAYMRPYEVKAELQQEIEAEFTYQRLPEDNHWRVAFGMTVSSMTDGNLAFTITSAVEAIVIFKTDEVLDEDTFKHVFATHVGSCLVGHVRTRIHGLSMDTGYQPVMLPPLDATRFVALLEEAVSV